MNKIVGCVISNSRLKEFKSECWSYEVVEGLPILYVGYDNASENINCFDVTRRVYDGDVWWCFGKTERRKDYLDTVGKFKAAAFHKAAASVKYEYVDFTCYPMHRIKAFIKYIKGGDRKVCFVTRGRQFVFIYSEKYNTVWGLSLTLCEYIGVDSGKVLSQMKTNRKNVFIKDTSFIDKEIREIIGNDTHFIPILATYLR